VKITQFVEIETFGGKEDILPQATPEALRRLKWSRTIPARWCTWCSTIDFDPVQTVRTRNEPCSRFAGTLTFILVFHRA